MRKRRSLASYDLTHGRPRWAARRSGYDVPLVQKRTPPFWSFVEKTEGCWLWRGPKGRAGYGAYRIKRRMHFAHRLAWAEVHGPIPSGLFVCHHCDNPPCVNPAHLFIGTQKDNRRDCTAKGRNPGNKTKRGWRLVLSDRQVEEIKALKGILSQRQLARNYGVSPMAIRAIHA